MGKTEPKKILAEAEMKAQVEKAISVYNASDRSARNLYLLINVLNDIHNNACYSGQEMTWLPSWVANFPDN